MLVKEQAVVRYRLEVLEYFRSTGKVWQTRMDEALAYLPNHGDHPDCLTKDIHAKIQV